MRVRERAQAIHRANQAMHQLATDQSTTRHQLGRARDLVNRVHNLADAEQIRDAGHQLEDMARHTNQQQH